MLDSLYNNQYSLWIDCFISSSKFSSLNYQNKRTDIFHLGPALRSKTPFVSEWIKVLDIL